MSNPQKQQAGEEQPEDGPVSLRLAVLALWIEALLLLGFAVFQAVALFVFTSQNPGVSAVLAALTAALAALIYRLGVLLTRRHSWPRAVCIVVQLMALPVAFFMVTGDGNGLLVQILGGAIGLYGLACAALLLAPSSRLALRRPPFAA